MSYSTPTKHDGRAVLFAVAEFLVMYWRLAQIIFIGKFTQLGNY